jgi:hypothetical protein
MRLKGMYILENLLFNINTYDKKLDDHEKVLVEQFHFLDAFSV